MPRFINEGCVKCGACTADCPVEAISEGDTKFQVDPEVCIDCGECHCPFGKMSVIPRPKKKKYVLQRM